MLTTCDLGQTRLVIAESVERQAKHQLSNYQFIANLLILRHVMQGTTQQCQIFLCRAVLWQDLARLATAALQDGIVPNKVVHIAY